MSSLRVGTTMGTLQIISIFHFVLLFQLFSKTYKRSYHWLKSCWPSQSQNVWKILMEDKKEKSENWRRGSVDNVNENLDGSVTLQVVFYSIFEIKWSFYFVLHHILIQVYRIYFFYYTIFSNQLNQRAKLHEIELLEPHQRVVRQNLDMYMSRDIRVQVWP